MHYSLNSRKPWSKQSSISARINSAPCARFRFSARDAFAVLKLEAEAPHRQLTMNTASSAVCKWLRTRRENRFDGFAPVKVSLNNFACGMVVAFVIRINLSNCGSRGVDVAKREQTGTCRNAL